MEYVRVFGRGNGAAPAIVRLNIHILDGDGQSIDTFGVTAVNGEGELTISPPSCWLSVALLNKDHKSVYCSGMDYAHDRAGLPYFQHFKNVDLVRYDIRNFAHQSFFSV